jgi:hypothetical protein
MLAEKYRSPTFSPNGQKILAFYPYREGKNVTTGVAVFSLNDEILHQYNIVVRVLIKF